MFKLHVIQAQFGDSLLLEFGTGKPQFILIDGGPGGVYDTSLRPELVRIIGDGGRLEALVISHIDIDHIQGAVDLLAELKSDKDNAKPLFLNIKEVWLNSFSAVIDDTGELIERMNSLYAIAGQAAMESTAAGIAVEGVKEGDRITRFCTMLDINMNPEANKGFFIADPGQTDVNFGNLKFIITGPTQANLDSLKKDWDKWLKEQEKKIANGTFEVQAMTDKSVPNLSSLTFLVAGEGKTILFTGDGRGDHLIQGLDMKGLLKDGKFHVDILKVAHHGSDRDTDRSFFDHITADTYVISANGKYDNPDYDTLTWIVEAAKAAERKVKLVVTNNTSSTQKLQVEYPPADWGYTIVFIADKAFSFEIDLAN